MTSFLSRRISRIYSLLKETPHRRPDSVFAFGQNFILPVRQSDIKSVPYVHPTVLNQIFHETVTISALTYSQNCPLHLVQGINHPEILILFCNNFGGVVRLHQPGVGSIQATCIWSLGSSNARETAVRMLDFKGRRQK